MAPQELRTTTKRMTKRMTIIMGMDKGQRKTPSTSLRLPRVQNEVLMSLLRGARLMTRMTKKLRRELSPRRLGCDVTLNKGVVPLRIAGHITVVMLSTSSLLVVRLYKSLYF